MGGPESLGRVVDAGDLPHVIREELPALIHSVDTGAK
jgi:hypothetical protein